MEVIMAYKNLKFPDNSVFGNRRRNGFGSNLVEAILEMGHKVSV